MLIVLISIFAVPLMITVLVNPIPGVAVLALVEIIYVSKRVISPVYLADAIIKLILIGWWLAKILLT